ncbi:hypothetical protein Acid345_1873 [Candidatus Koribacter versatilis Ellin345]|uniref:Glycine zipper domain-containing protein n=1 Tax=Koribacter versatilis (strain Ellin345) TaxID=204669 RepID=Q1IQH6_KORVE|nr:hypothetical protein [Candidatus Koribacter versatilis]ABF40874.1 hypothetical protein Acid345_1873 [Candidatus Koribacter versatilis Ellin345]
MRSVIAALLSIFLGIAPAVAQPSGDWIKVEKIPFESVLRVELWNGDEYVGLFHSADDTVLRLKVRDPNQNGLTVRREVSRHQVHVVEQLGGKHVDPYKYLSTGQIVGGAAGAASIGIAAGRAWPLGVLIGGLAGAAIGTAVGGTVGIVANTKNHRRKIIYMANQAPAKSESTSLPAVVF